MRSKYTLQSSMYGVLSENAKKEPERVNLPPNTLTKGTIPIRK